jgi:hypothetical protein
VSGYVEREREMEEEDDDDNNNNNSSSIYSVYSASYFTVKFVFVIPRFLKFDLSNE